MSHRRSTAATAAAAARVVGLAAAAMLLSGCAPNLLAEPLPVPPTATALPSAGAEEPDAPAVRLDTVACRTLHGPLEQSPGAAATEPPVPEPRRLPSGFEVAAALGCDFEMRDAGREDGALEVVVTVTRYEGDFGPLITALSAPDDVATPDTVCALSMEFVPPLWLEGADGSLVSVRYPADRCGKTKPAVAEALADLAPVSVEKWSVRD